MKKFRELNEKVEKGIKCCFKGKCGDCPYYDYLDDCDRRLYDDFVSVNKTKNRFMSLVEKHFVEEPKSCKDCEHYRYDTPKNQNLCCRFVLDLIIEDIKPCRHFKEKV